jgi:hypothetical protein
MESCDLLCLDLPAAERVRATLDPARSAVVASTLKVFADPTRLLIAQALSELSCAAVISGGSRGRATRWFPITLDGCGARGLSKAAATGTSCSRR